MPVPNLNATETQSRIEFAKRLNQLCDRHPDCPDLHYGRINWIAENANVTPQAVNKWVHARARPRPTTMEKIAKVFNADRGWLATGYNADSQKLRASVDKEYIEKISGAAKVVAGLIEMAGGNVAPPEPDEDGFDFFAIINRHRHYVSVTVAYQREDGSFFFSYPDFEPIRTYVCLMPTGAPDVYDLVRIAGDVVQQAGTEAHGATEFTAVREGDAYIDGRGNAYEKITDIKRQL